MDIRTTYLSLVCVNLACGANHHKIYIPWQSEHKPVHIHFNTTERRLYSTTNRFLEHAHASHNWWNSKDTLSWDAPVLYVELQRFLHLPRLQHRMAHPLHPDDSPLDSLLDGVAEEILCERFTS